MWNDGLLQKKRRGELFVISAPAGAGKTTLAKKLVETFSSVEIVPSLTTRAPRRGEIEGIDYYFVSKEEFDARRERGEFLEEVFIHGAWYATSKVLIEKCRNSGKHAVLIIDTRGALAVQKQTTSVLVFVKPPSFDVLYQRLKERGTESEEDQKKRMEWAKRELLEENRFDFSIVNDTLDRAFDILASIVVSQTHRVEG